MDFSFDAEQTALAELAGEMFADLLTQQRRATVSESASGWDAQLWATVAEAGLIGLTLPAEYGGSEQGPVEACLVAREVGRAVAPIPYSSVVATAAALALLPPARRPDALLTDVAAGQVLVGHAVPMTDGEPFLALKVVDGGWTAHGVLPVVAHAVAIDLLLTAVATPGGVPAALLLDLRSPEVVVEPLRLSGGEPAARVVVGGLLVAEEDLFEGDVGALLLQRARLQHLVLSSAEMAGLAEAALRLTADYTHERRQFGRPLGAFQAVACRAADAFIDLQVMTWTMWNAASVLSDQGTEVDATARDAVSVARFWAAEGGHRVLSAAQHLHGGVGIDMDYPLHRYFLRGKQIEFGLGGASAHLAELGRSLADRSRDLP